MKIEILYINGCPSIDQAKSVVESALKDLGADAELTIRVIKDEKEARENGFLGSPTILIDGQDIEPHRRYEKPVWGLRTYRTTQGEEKSVPPKSWVTAGILRALRNRDHLSATLYEMWEDLLKKGSLRNRPC
jgi:hypothetical protein